MSSLPQPGWYPCPENTSNVLRWWNGIAWTTSTRDLSQQSSTPGKTAFEGLNIPQSETDLVRTSTRNRASTITAVLAIILVILSLPLMFTTMGTEVSNCGTIWASEDTWKYSSTYDGPEGYFNSRTSPKSSVAAAVGDLMADWSRGAAAFEDCKNKHHDRMMILLMLGGTAVILVAFSIGLRIAQNRSSAAPGQ